jgi:hypothetical protein
LSVLLPYAGALHSSDDRDTVRLRLLTLGLVTSLTTMGLLPATALAASEPAAGTIAERAAARAHAALVDAQALFTPHAHRAGAPGRGRDATMVLLDLARQADRLATPTLRRQARAVLARPTDGSGPTGGIEPPDYGAAAAHRVCGAHVCVHWVESGDHRTDPTDTDANGVPDQVDRTLAAMEHVYGVEVTDMGYRAPLPDSSAPDNGGDGLLDVYLADIGTQGLYGYCTSDQPDLGAVRRTYAYCVLDNDYSPAQFGTRNTPLQDLRVTAAHEFFHAVQYAYSWNRAAWLMEGTAAWMEDEVYDQVDDNRQYLAVSPLTYPNASLSSFDYGAWIFWRFLSEWTGPGASEDPTVVRDVWTRAAGVSAVSALNSVLAARGTSFATAFRTFGVWERNPRLHFSEGGAYHPVRTAKSFALGPVHRRTGAWVAQLDHMSRDVVRFTPGSRLRGTWRLRVQLDMAKTSRGSAAQVLVHHRDGSVDVHVVRLSSAGDAVRHYKFSRSHVSSIDLDLVNASTSSGDDYRPEVFSARVER